MKTAMMLAGALLALSVPNRSGAQAGTGPFPDVPRDHWAFQAVESLRQKGILLGYPDGPRAAKSGVDGKAEVGPVRPVQREGETNTRPLAGAIITFQPKGGGREITRTKCDSGGRFRVELAPGTYRLVALPPNPGSRYPRGSEQAVTVKSGQLTHVTVEYDSGIR